MSLVGRLSYYSMAFNVESGPPAMWGPGPGPLSSLHLASYLEKVAVVLLPLIPGVKG